MVMPTAEEVKIDRPCEANLLYYMCLLKWSGKVLDETTHKAVAHSIMPNIEPTNGWYVTQGEDSELRRHGVKPEFLCGFYHSRLILRFELEGCPETISKVREIRGAVEGYTDNYLRQSILPGAQKVTGIDVKAFIYPVFELKTACPLWKVTKTSPYTLSTTCFYTNLRDPERTRWRFLNIPGLRALVNALAPAAVKIRISGAQIITSPMSEWFFSNLTNIVYHEGLYRQSGVQQIDSVQVYKGLESRLEDFADSLMASLTQSLTSDAQVLLNRCLVGLTISLVVLTIVLLLMPSGT